MNNDPRETIASMPMRRPQILIVALCIAMNALDGFDVLAISFAAPGITREWGIDPATLGVVLSMELFGMAAGSVAIGNIADRIGRRPAILTCLAMMAAGMLATSLANSIPVLLVLRLLTGLGIGGMLSSTSATVAEFSNDRRRNLNVSLNIAGYPSGAILGGLIASALLEADYGWRSLFVFGGAMTVLLLPLAFLFLPEPVEALLARRPADALGKVNRTLARLGLASIAALPATSAEAPKPSFTALFSRGYAAPTVLLTVAYFAQIMLFYFVIKWIPTIVVGMGFTAAEAARVLVFANIGNLLGAVLIGFAAQRFPLRPVIIGAMVAGFVTICVFGIGFRDTTQLAIIAAIATFFINAGVVGLYPILAWTYPAHLRAGGTGFVIGVGRGGSAIGPVVAGALFASGASLLTVSLIMGAAGLVAAMMLVLLPRMRADPERSPAV